MASVYDEPGFLNAGDSSGADRAANALISADRVQGTAVYNGQSERLGNVDSIMIDKRSGQVAYVVMSFGGFLGIGEKYHPLPWDVLTYDENEGGYRVNLDREQLTAAPAFDRDGIDNYDYDRNASDIDDYYAGSGPRSDVGHAKSGAAGDQPAPAYDETNRSDANDGISRPLGYFSTQAQADRNAHIPGTTPTNETAGGPGFYSPEQQVVRNDDSHPFINGEIDQGDPQDRLRHGDNGQDPSAGSVR